MRIGRLTFWPRLSTILLIVNLAILILPLGSIFFFRIYENQLVQETERELIAQAAFIAAMYEQEVEELALNVSAYGMKLADPPAHDPNEYYRPVDPQLDLAAVKTLPRRPDGLPPPRETGPAAAEVGRRLDKVLNKAQRTTLSGMRLLDYNGVVIGGSGERGLSFAHVAEVAAARKGRYTSVIRYRVSRHPTPPVASISRGTGVRIFIAYPIVREGWLWGVVYLSRTPKSILKHMYAERQKVILAGITILALATALALLTSSTISRPVKRLIERTRRVAAGERQALRPLENPGTREMALLSNSFSKMAGALHERSEYIRGFATHVSHEFKTPLTSIQGAAELLRDHAESMPPPERDRFLDNIAKDAHRLQRLVTRLLELARADNLKPSKETIDVPLALHGLQRRYSGADFTVEIDDMPSVYAPVSRENFDMIVSNLAENARQHGAGTLHIGLRQLDSRLELIFADDGDGVSPANREKIFTPFFTTRRENGGTGLGLGIIKSLLEAHGGTIALADSDRGASFIITLPIAPSKTDEA